MTSTNLPAGVWRDDHEAAKLACGRLDGVTFDGGKRFACLGSACTACREYRRPDNTSVQPDGSLPPPDGYYCGKAGRP